MSVAHVMYTESDRAEDFEYLAEMLRTQDWPTEKKNSEAIMQVIDKAALFLDNAVNNVFENHFPLVGKPQPCIISVRAFRAMGRLCRTEQEQNANKQALHTYLFRIEQIRAHFSSGKNHDLSEEELAETADFFSKIAILDKAYAQANYRADRAASGCF